VDGRDKPGCDPRQDHARENIIMASIYKDISLEAPADEVWAAVRDYGAVHRRLAPGFVTGCKLDGDGRIVTFANGNVAQELLVTIDDARMRLVYAVVSPRVKQHSASIHILADGDRRSRMVWIADVLPNEIGRYVEGQMDLGALAIQKMFRRNAA
jgi:Polyketide cyclase / dehydrase and lipid transport